MMNLNLTLKENNIINNKKGSLNSEQIISIFQILCKKKIKILGILIISYFFIEVIKIIYSL